MLNIDLYSILKCFSKELALAYERRRRRGIIRFLKSVSPHDLEKYGERSALKVFQIAASSVSFYQRLLKEKGIKVNQINSIKDFKRLPILEKNIFQDNEIIDLIENRNLGHAKSILTSSGYSGIFSFGVNSDKNLANTGRLIDLGLDYVFEVGKKKTLLINCLPMGVKVYSNECVIADVSVREDMALALVKKFHPYFKQIIIIGEAFFLKFLVEEGLKKGIDWKHLPISLIAGEDSFPESYRTYMAEMMGIDLEKKSPRFIGSSLGIAELDLNLFYETRDTIMIRRYAQNNSEFRKALLEEDLEVCPMFFVYYPHRVYLEKNEAGELIFTMLSPYLEIPLVRYNSKDGGKIISYNQLKEVLKNFHKEDLLPKLKLPLVVVKARAKAKVDNVSGDKIRDIIFSNPQIVRELTGFFKIKPNKTSVEIKLQLKKNGLWQREYEQIIKSNLTGATKKITIQAIPYYEFSEALVLDYNKKFHHT